MPFRSANPGFSLSGLLGLLLVLAGAPLPAAAIYSCDASAGRAVSGGAGDSCGLNKYAVSVSSQLDGAGVGYTGSAATSLLSGSQSGYISIYDNNDDGAGPPPSNGTFASNLLAEFRFSGPASAAPVPAKLALGASGSISGSCVNCEAGISYRGKLEGPGLVVEVTGGRSRTEGWTTSSTTSGLGSFAAIAASSGGFGGTVGFDIAGVLGQTFRLTSSLGGRVAFTGANPSGSMLIADASHTVLFNLLLPDGYSIVGVPSSAPFLSDPLLTAPVPEPATGLLLLAGGAGVLTKVWRRRPRRA